MSASTQTWRWSSWSPIRRATQVDDRRPGGGGVTGGMLGPWTYYGSCAGGDEDEVGHEAGEESEDDAPGGDFLVTELAGDSQEFDHDVENRACGEGETHHEDRVIDYRLPDEGSDESGTAADEPQDEQKRPRRGLTLRGHRGDDAETLGRVVQPEADDEQQRQADLAGGGGLADGQALGEVVEADPQRDEERQSLRVGEAGNGSCGHLLDRRGAGATGLPASEPPVVVDEAHEADGDGGEEERREPDEAPPRRAVVVGVGE